MAARTSTKLRRVLCCCTGQRDYRSNARQRGSRDSTGLLPGACCWIKSRLHERVTSRPNVRGLKRSGARSGAAAGAPNNGCWTTRHTRVPRRSPAARSCWISTSCLHTSFPYFFSSRGNESVGQAGGRPKDPATALCGKSPLRTILCCGKLLQPEGCAPEPPVLNTRYLLHCGDLIVFLFNIVGCPAVCYVFYCGPPDQTRAVGIMYYSGVAADGLGCQSLPSRASPSASHPASKNVACTTSVSKKRLSSFSS